MALKELVARLEREAQARADAALTAAQEKVAAIERQAMLLSSREEAAVLAERRSERRSRLERELAAVRGRVRGVELEARRQTVERVLSRAQALCAQRDVPGTAPIVEALLFFGGARVRATCQPRWRDALVAAGVEVVIDAAAPAGVVLEAHDGSCSIDLRLATRLEARRAELSVELVKELAS